MTDSVRPVPHSLTEAVELDISNAWRRERIRRDAARTAKRHDEAELRLRVVALHRTASGAGLT